MHAHCVLNVIVSTGDTMRTRQNSYMGGGRPGNKQGNRQMG